jgi:hypothetical protein
MEPVRAWDGRSVIDESGARGDGTPKYNRHLLDLPSEHIAEYNHGIEAIAQQN